MKTIFEMMRKRQNKILRVDAYGFSHNMLKIDTSFEVSHMYNRRRPQILFLFSHYVAEAFGTPITMEDVDEAHEIAKEMGLVFPRHIFERVVNEFKGYFPIKVEALPDGFYCPVGTPFCQISNVAKDFDDLNAFIACLGHAGFGELVSWDEAYLMKAYFPAAAATHAFEMREYLEQQCKEHGYDWEQFKWRFHSFGYRGHASEQNAALAGLAWNMSLFGTDDIHTKQYYRKAPVGSVAASAHKVVQQFDDELQSFLYGVDAVAEAFHQRGEGSPIFPFPIDTYNANNVIQNYIPVVAKYAAEKDVRITPRPDSGNVIQQAIDIYHVAQEHGLTNVSVIIGEGMSFEQVKKYDAILLENNVPLNFVLYGIGAGFYTHLTRDYLGWAMKTSFSNKDSRMKFSEVPIKQSIPGIVKLFIDEEMNMVVDYSNDGKYAGAINADNGLYNILYHFDGSTDKPFVKVFTIEENHMQIESQREARVADTIVIAPAIKEEIKRIRALHGLS